MDPLNLGFSSQGPGRLSTFLRLTAIAGLLMVGLSAWRGMAPLILLLLQILFGIGQFCVTIFRIYGF